MFQKNLNPIFNEKKNSNFQVGVVRVFFYEKKVFFFNIYSLVLVMGTLWYSRGRQIKCNKFTDYFNRGEALIKHVNKRGKCELNT